MDFEDFLKNANFFFFALFFFLGSLFGFALLFVGMVVDLQPEWAELIVFAFISLLLSHLVFLASRSIKEFFDRHIHFKI